jgi:hypothetical protein
VNQLATIEKAMSSVGAVPRISAARIRTESLELAVDRIMARK